MNGDSDGPVVLLSKVNQTTWVLGREPWSSGYGRRLTFRRSWVRIPAPYTGWTFFTYCKNCNVCLKRPKINEKEAGVGPFFLKKQPGFSLADNNNACYLLDKLQHINFNFPLKWCSCAIIIRDDHIHESCGTNCGNI